MAIRLATRIVPLAVRLAIVGLALLPAAGWGQGFDVGSQAFTPGTRVSLTLRSLSSDSTTEVAGVTEAQSTSKAEGATAFAGIQIDPLLIGLGGDVDDVEQETQSVRIENRRESTAAFVTLDLGRFATVLSTSRFVENAEFEDFNTGISVTRGVEVNTDVQLGLFLHLGFFRAGYSAGVNRMKLEFDVDLLNVPLTQIVERFKFQTDSRDFALLLGGESGPFFTARYSVTKAPATQGDLFDFGGSREEIQSASAGWRFDGGSSAAFVYSTSESDLSFPGLTELNVRQESRRIVTQLDGGMRLEAAQTVQRTRDEFTQAGGLETIKNKRTRIEVGIGWRF